MVFIIVLKIGLGFDQDIAMYDKAYRTREKAEEVGRKAMEDYNNDEDNYETCMGYTVYGFLVEE